MWGCFKHIGIPFEELNKMPVRDRKFFIAKHNKEIEEKNKKMEHSSKKRTRTITGEAINNYAMSEMNAKDAMKR